MAQEERKGTKDFPGVRTFAFLALLGALAVLVMDPFGAWMSVALFAASAMFLLLRYRHDTAMRGDPGYTTEIASLCTFAVGALAQSGQLLIATSITIAMVALLRSKSALHWAGDLLEPADMEALIRFLVITGIVLPLLPSEPLDPYFQVLRPRDIWRIVVLISSVSFVGYVLMRLRVGRSSHIVLGLLSGLVSSTAAAVSYVRAARQTQTARPFETLVVLAASTAFVRIAIMLAIVGPAVLSSVILPLLVMFLVGVALVFLRHAPSAQAGQAPDFTNPLKLRLALSFAALYAVVLLVVAAVHDRLGEAGVYVASGLAALVGADAPSLSLARLEVYGQLPLETAVIGVVLVAVMATLGKVAIVAALGSRKFALRVIPTLVGIAASGVLSLYLL